MFLDRITRHPGPIGAGFPWTVPLIANMRELAFTHLLRARLRPNGLYLLEEPETPLSPSRVLASITLLQQGMAQGSQFVVASHPPTLLVLPGAAILEASGGHLIPVAWNDLDPMRVTRAFLNDPESVLRRLRD